MGRPRVVVGIILATALGMLVPASSVGRTVGGPLLSVRTPMAAAYGKLPLAFEPNLGQAPAGIEFLAHGPGYTLALAGGLATLSLQAGDGAATPESRSRPGPGTLTASAEPGTGATGAARAVRLRLVGATADPGVQAGDPLPGVVNYFIGNDPARWHTDVPTYAKVTYADVYPGIALIYYGNGGRLEHDFVVAPGANPSVIALSLSGADALSPESDGALRLSVGDGVLQLEPPTIYQDTPGGRIRVAGGYRLGADHVVAFAVGAYDHGRPLVIDPVLAYSTYLGNGVAGGNAIALDSAGDAYIAGSTFSPGFPTTPGAFQTTFHDGFVSKLNATGTALVYSTYLGGTGYGQSNGIAVDAEGDAYVTGLTDAADFPTTPGAFQRTYFGGTQEAGDGFVTKLNLTGTALVYSTYLGGSGGSSGGQGNAVAVDSLGDAYVSGQTTSPSFPVTPGAFQTTLLGYQSVFVTKMNPIGTAPVYSTYLGGSGYNGEWGYGIAVDGAGDAYVTGVTESSTFPTTPGAFQTTYNSTIPGGSNAFVTKLNAAGTALVYSTYLSGSSGNDFGNGVAVDGAGDAYVTGQTFSSDFPTTPDAFQRGIDNGSSSDAFVTKLNPSGTALAYSTYLGGDSADKGNAIAVDGSGDAFVTGKTSSANFPITPGAIQLPLNGGTLNSGVFVTELNPTGAALLYSTYLGGTTGSLGPNQWGLGIAVDGAGAGYVTGYTNTTNFPTTPGAFQTTAPGTGPGIGNAFVTKLNVPTTLLPGVGGTNLVLTAAAGGTSVPAWQGGTQQTGYYVLRLSDTGSVVLGALPATATSTADNPPSGDILDCYADLAVSGPTVLAVSDLLCRVPGVQAGRNAPFGFNVQLDKTQTATLGWVASAPQELTGYTLAAIALDQPGAQWVTAALPPGAVSAVVNLGTHFTCFILIAQSATTVLGYTDLLCADPQAATQPAATVPHPPTRQQVTSIIQRLPAVRSRK